MVEMVRNNLGREECLLPESQTAGHSHKYLASHFHIIGLD
jgi:hypothetical protein